MYVDIPAILAIVQPLDKVRDELLYLLVQRQKIDNDRRCCFEDF